MSADEDGVSLTRSMLMESLKTIRQFDWLIDSYVLDFFVDELWNKLPLSWQDYFSNFDLQSLCYFLDLNSANDGIEKVVPLSLSALRVLLNRNIIQREAINSINVEDPGKQYLHSHKRLKKIFEKHIKPKKLHEIDKFSSLCNEISKKTNTNHIVDVGAGLGHLSRVLSFSYGLKMCCIEQQPSLTQQARLIDRDLENRITKLKLPGTCVYAPMHKNLRISNDIDVNQFQTMAFDDAKGMGLIGLHPCGDLGPILMNYFIRGDSVKFLCIAGCCFMKLTTDKTNAFVGYPLSEFLLTKEDNLVVLSYEAREVSCHAVEMYCKRLIEGLYEELQIHCYRATLEEILVKYSNDFKHLGLKSVKHKNNLIFLDYCSKATNHLNIRFREEDLTSNRVTDCLKRWKQVVIFYSLRLMLAPLIESVILLDRKLYILENGYNCDILPVFDPQLSPRNHILVAYKP